MYYRRAVGNKYSKKPPAVGFAIPTAGGFASLKLSTFWGTVYTEYYPNYGSKYGAEALKLTIERSSAFQLLLAEGF